MNYIFQFLAFMLIFMSSTQKVKENINTFGPQLQQAVIWQDDSENNDPLSVGFRKKVEIGQTPEEAQIMIFADSRYVLWINGVYIERGPCRFDPKGPQYDVIGVSDHLHKGLNTIAIMVQGFIKENLKVMKHRPGLSVLLEIDNQQFFTDETWLCSDNIPEQMIIDRRTWSCLLDKVDANTQDYNWQLPEFDDNNWKPAIRVPGNSWGPLSPRSIPLLREHNLGAGTILQVRNNKTTNTSLRKLSDHLPLSFKADDEIVIDVGKLSLIYWKITMNAEKDTELIFTPCQDFVNGETIISYNCITTYKARKGLQSYMSNDTFGFRYLNIKVVKGSLSLNTIEFVSRLYPNIKIAEFDCNDDFLNKTWLQSSYSATVLSEDGYVDSAERAEWMGDVGMIQYPVSRMVVSGPGKYPDEILYSDPRLMRNMLIHTAQSQQPDGRLKAHHPSDRYDLHWYIEDYSCLWIQGLKQYYENTADIKLVEELWPVLVKQLDWFLYQKNESGLVTAREFLIHLDNPMRYQVCQGATLNAFIYKAFLDAAYLADALGMKKEAVSYRVDAESLKSAFNTYLWDEISGSIYAAVYYPEIEHGDVLPELKLVPIEDPASEREGWSDGNVQWIETGEKVPPTVQAALVALNKGVVAEEYLIDVHTFLMNHYSELKNPYTHLMLFDELYKHDQDSSDILVLNIIRNRWREMVSRESPGTSAEGFKTQGYLCHPFGLVPAYSLPSYVLGVRKPFPIWERTIRIEPRLGDLLYVRGVGLTEHGPVPVEWQKISDHSLKFRFEIPGETEAYIRLPKQGSQNQILLNDQPINYISRGRFLEFKVSAGTYEGIISSI